MRDTARQLADGLHSLGLLQGTLGAFALRDVGPDATITGEIPVSIEYRLAAIEEIANLVIGTDPALFEITKRLALVQAQLLLPRLFFPNMVWNRHLGIDFLESSPQVVLCRNPGACREPLGNVGETQIGIRLPKPIGGRLREIAEPFLAFRQCHLRSLAPVSQRSSDPNDQKCENAVGDHHPKRPAFGRGGIAGEGKRRSDGRKE